MQCTGISEVEDWLYRVKDVRVRGALNGEAIANTRLGGTRQKFNNCTMMESNTAVGVCVRGPAGAVYVWLVMEAHQQGPERHLACPPNLWDAGPK